MVVLDPRRTETAKVADEHHFVRPGTDAAVLLAMVHVLFAEGLADARRRTSRGSTRCAAPSPPFTPERAERVSGVPADDDPAARPRARGGRRAAVYGRMGVSTQGFGSVCQWAINCLNLLTGNFDREGGVLFTEPAVDIGRARAASAAATSTCGAAGCAGSRSSPASCRSRAARGDRDAGRRARSARC